MCVFSVDLPAQAVRDFKQQYPLKSVSEIQSTPSEVVDISLSTTNPADVTLLRFRACVVVRCGFYHACGLCR